MGAAAKDGDTNVVNADDGDGGARSFNWGCSSNTE
jgi:hypothetical protein